MLVTGFTPAVYFCFICLCFLEQAERLSFNNHDFFIQVFLLFYLSAHQQYFKPT